MCVCVFFNRFTWVMGFWTGWMMGLGGSWFLGGRPELKTKGGPSPFFLFSENFTCSKKKFLGPGLLWARCGSVPDFCFLIYSQANGLVSPKKKLLVYFLFFFFFFLRSKIEIFPNKYQERRMNFWTFYHWLDNVNAHNF